MSQFHIVTMDNSELVVYPKSSEILIEPGATLYGRFLIPCGTRLIFRGWNYMNEVEFRVEYPRAPRLWGQGPYR